MGAHRLRVPLQWTVPQGFHLFQSVQINSQLAGAWVYEQGNLEAFCFLLCKMNIMKVRILVKKELMIMDIKVCFISLGIYWYMGERE